MLNPRLHPLDHSWGRYSKILVLGFARHFFVVIFESFPFLYVNRICVLLARVCVTLEKGHWGEVGTSGTPYPPPSWSHCQASTD